MRKLIVSNMMSLDGYYEGPGADVMALPMEHSFDAYNAERLRAADAMVLGAATFELLRGFWPQVADDPNASLTEREVARLNGAIDKLVVSDRIGPEQTEPWRYTTTIVRRADALAQLTHLKEQDGKDIIVFGSRTLWHGLLAAGLVDELHVMVGPLVLGGGTPALGGVAASSLRLLDTRSWEGSGNVLLRYAAAPAS